MSPTCGVPFQHQSQSLAKHFWKEILLISLSSQRPTQTQRAPAPSDYGPQVRPTLDGVHGPEEVGGHPGTQEKESQQWPRASYFCAQLMNPTTISQNASFCLVAILPQFPQHAAWPICFISPVNSGSSVMIAWRTEPRKTRSPW